MELRQQTGFIPRRKSMVKYRLCFLGLVEVFHEPSLVFLGLAWCFVHPHKSWLSNNCFCWCGLLLSFHGKSWHYAEILNLQIFSSAHLLTLWELHRPYCHIFSALNHSFFHDTLWLLKLLPPFMERGAMV